MDNASLKLIKRRVTRGKKHVIASRQKRERLLSDLSMLSNNDFTASTASGIPEPTTPDNAPVDLPSYLTPTVHKQSTAMPFTSGHIMRDETLIALGNEMIGYVVGPMPAKDFLELLPRNSRKSPTFRKKPFADLADQSTELQMYDPFVCIIFSFFYPYTALPFLDQGDEKILPQPSRYQHL